MGVPSQEYMTVVYYSSKVFELFILPFGLSVLSSVFLLLYFFVSKGSAYTSILSIDNDYKTCVVRIEILIKYILKLFKVINKSQYTHEYVDLYGISVPQMLTDMFKMS